MQTAWFFRLVRKRAFGGRFFFWGVWKGLGYATVIFVVGILLEIWGLEAVWHRRADSHVSPKRAQISKWVGLCF